MKMSRNLQLQSVAGSDTHNGRLEEELAPAVLESCASLWREYAELAKMAPSEFSVSRHELLSWYAELQFKTRGGGKCSQCGAHVRHALKVRAERHDGSTRTYLCLCTRCLVAEEALSTRVLHLAAGQWIESHVDARHAHPQSKLQAA